MSITTSTWNAYQSIRLMHNFSQLVTQEKNTDFALRNLQVLAERFYYQALDRDYKSNLTDNEISELKKNFTHLTGIIKTNVDAGKLSSSLNGNGKRFAAIFQISLLKILRYILSKTSSGLKDYHWRCNAVKFGLETAVYCNEECMWTEMRFCLSEAEFYQEQLVPSELPVDFRAPYHLNGSLLNILNLIWMHSNADINDAEIVYFLPCLVNGSLELSRKQVDFVYSLCYNIGLSCFNQEQYQGAILCLKTSIHFAKSAGKDDQSRNKRLSLLADCFYNLNVAEHSQQIHHILNCADESAVNIILRLRTYLASKSEVNSITSCILKYFKIQINNNNSNLRAKICRIFDVLEKNEHDAVIVQLLNRIPWQEEEEEPISETIGNSSHNPCKWIFSEIAVRTCVRHRYFKGCYHWLNEIANRQPSKLVDRKSVEAILCLTEHKAMCYFNQQKTLKALRWYDVLIKIGLRHGGLQTEMIYNAIFCYLAIGTVEGLESAKSLLQASHDLVVPNLKLLRFKWLIAIQDQDHIKAVEVWLQLNMKYKEENPENGNNWKEAKGIIEQCIVWAVKNEMHETLVHCLNALIHEFKNQSIQFAVIIDVIKIHLNVLLNHTSANSFLETKCLEHLLTALISAYILYQETLVSLDYDWDSGGLELWFGSWAWNLARRFTHILPFFRHQLFKLSYKMFSLTPEQDEGIRSKIETGIIFSLAAGINSESQEDPPYIQILNGCLTIIKDYTDVFSANNKLLRFYEFYILCQLGEVKNVTEKFEGYQQEDKIRNDAEFFEGLSALASSHSEPFFIQLLPRIERQAFRKENHHVRQLKLQIQLDDIAVRSLKVANSIYLKSSDQSIANRMSINWKRILSIASEHLFLLDHIEARYLNLCEEYHFFLIKHAEQLESTEVNNLFNRVWNITMEMETYKGWKAAERWISLIREISHSSSDLQKLYRSLVRRASTNTP